MTIALLRCNFVTKDLLMLACSHSETAWSNQLHLGCQPICLTLPISFVIPCTVPPFSFQVPTLIGRTIIVVVWSVSCQYLKSQNDILWNNLCHLQLPRSPIGFLVYTLLWLAVSVIART